jgi:hypothetical protein
VRNDRNDTTALSHGLLQNFEPVDLGPALRNGAGRVVFPRISMNVNAVRWKLTFVRRRASFSARFGSEALRLPSETRRRDASSQ